jgi:hypothetical protein
MPIWFLAFVWLNLYCDDHEQQAEHVSWLLYSRQYIAKIMTKNRSLFRANSAHLQLKDSDGHPKFQVRR